MASFKEKVFRVVKKIPRGRVRTYKEVAKRAKSPRACRVVGNVLNRNINPKIPCHRVIRSDRRVGGYRKGTKNKTGILKREGIKIRNGKIASRFN